MDSRLPRLGETVVRIVPMEIVQTAVVIAAVVVDRGAAVEEVVVADRAVEAVAVGVADQGAKKNQPRIFEHHHGSVQVI